MKLRTAFTSSLLLVSTSLLLARPASAEVVQVKNSAVVWTQGPATSSMYFQKAFIKRQAAFIRRDPFATPADLCDDLGPAKVVCTLLASRKDRILEAADANQCLKVRTPGSAMATIITLPIAAVTLDNSKYCN